MHRMTPCFAREASDERYFLKPKSSGLNPQFWILIQVPNCRHGPLQASFYGDGGGKSGPEYDFNANIIVAQKEAPKISQAGVKVNRLVAATKEIIYAKQNVKLITTINLSNGAGAQLNAFQFTEVLSVQTDDASPQTAHEVNVFGVDVIGHHFFGEAGGESVLGNDEGLEVGLPGRDHEINGRVVYLEEASTVGSPFATEGKKEDRKGKK
jgi:hypothetical protein